MTLLYHLTTLNLAIEAIKHNLLESTYDRSGREMASRGLENDHIKDLLDDTFHPDNYPGHYGFPFFAWFEDCHLIFSCSPTPQVDNKYTNDKFTRDYLVRFTVDVPNPIKEFEDEGEKASILSPSLDDKENDPEADLNYIGITALSLDHVVAIEASPRAQFGVRAARTLYGSEHIRSVPMKGIYYKCGELLEFKF